MVMTTMWIEGACWGVILLLGVYMACVLVNGLSKFSYKWITHG